MKDQNLLRHRSLVSCKLKAGCGAGDEESAGGWTALGEMVLYIFNYMELINSAVDLFQMCRLRQVKEAVLRQEVWYRLS